MTLPNAPSNQTPGNIEVLAAQNISIGCNAIAQNSLNGAALGQANITLEAGESIVTTPGCLSALGEDGTTSGVVYANATSQTVFSFDNDSLPWGIVYTNSLAPAIRTVVAGANITLASGVSATPGFDFQWFENGVALPAATNNILTLLTVDRSDQADYTVVVSTALTSFTFGTELRVLVPQIFTTPIQQPDGSVLISFGDDDGGSLTSQDSASFVVQVSADLVNWTTLPITPQPTGNGLLEFYAFPVSSAPSLAATFFRVLDH